jgi:hypothetical protein
MNKKEITEDDCIKWKMNKYINPHTTYEFKAKEKSKEYKRFKKACEGIKTPIKKVIIPKNVIINTQNEPITKELCYKWIANKKLINPITNSKIDKKGKLFKDIQNACIKLGIIDEKNKDILPEHKDLIDKYKKIIKKEKITKNPKYKLKNEPTKEECKKWIKNKLINPQTNIKIKKNGEIYLALKQKCSEFGLIIDDIERERFIFQERREKRRNDISNSIDSISSEIKPIIKEKIKKVEEELTEPYYPELNDPNFNKKLLELKEINVHKINKYQDILTYKDYEKKSIELCGDFDKSSFQYLMAHYLSYRTPYKSLLLYYGVGVGKTCSAITIAETLLVNHNSTDEPKIWVILPSATKEGFKSQIFNISKLIDNSLISNQCTGDTYIKLAQISKEPNIKIAEKKIRDLINTRYKFFTYEQFANDIDNYVKNNKIVMDKVIIIDEAHNIRSSGNNDKDKRVYSSLKEVCRNGINNRLVFLTATPMFNEPEDINELFYLLLLNDKRINLFKKGSFFDNNNNIKDDIKKYITLMSSNYISYLRGKNPFNFALKILPKMNNIEVLDRVIPLKINGEPIDEIDNNWINNLENNLVISKLSQKQIEFMNNDNNKILIDDDKVDDDNQAINSNFSLLNSTNIVFDKYAGSKGFNNFFVKEGDKEQLIVRYASKYKNALAPENIGLYSGKYAKIAEIIKKSKGIVIIYSRWIECGIIPIAIMLEHMGFTREGTNNILSEPAITNPVDYPDIKYPKYCILSSENPVYMGNTTIDKLRNKIINPLNTNGELVKVVLMTQVASEGLNFLNIREIHILDPWFHFNRIDQIIGRGIRNCSHNKLPIEERNVTVYLHCAINNYKKESLDVNAYRIATRKLYKSYIIDEIIRNNSIDCALFKNINYFPKSMFKLGPIKIITSQGKEIEYDLGDDEKFEPKCKVELDDLKENKIGFREETYKHLAINIQTKIKKIILDFIHNNRRFISYEYLKEIFDYVEPEILLHSIKISIYPNIIIDNIILLPHEDGIHIIDIIEDKPLKINIIKENIEIRRTKTDLDNNLYKKIKGIKNDNYYNAVFILYKSLDKYTFNILINKFFKFNRLNEIDDYIQEIFVKEGILIKQSEVPSISTTINDKYVGFVNIFNEEFEPLIYNPDEKNHHSFNKKQKEHLISNRILIKPPEDLTQEKYAWGLVVPVIDPENKKNKINVFKLLTPGVIYGKKTGIVCTSLQKNEHNKILTDLGIEDIKNTKTSYCNKIAIELAKRNRLSILPEYKPK